MGDATPVVLRGRFSYKERGAIGRGACARVYQGTDLLTGKSIAVKKVFVEKDGPQPERSIQREIELSLSLKHPHVVDVIDAWYEKCVIADDTLLGVAYIIMEHCDGGTLAQQLSSLGTIGSKKRELKVRRYLFQIVSALEYLRSKNVIHRDLKCANVLLTNNKKVIKLCDFGASRHLDTEQLGKTLCGTPYNMSPEIYLGQPYNEKTDLWSLGVIIYECIYGKTVFSSCRDHAELRAAMLKDCPVLFPKHPNVSAECSDLMFHLLKKDPVCRLSWSELYMHSWWNGLGSIKAPIVEDIEDEGADSFEEIKPVGYIPPGESTPIAIPSKNSRRETAFSATPIQLVENYTPSPPFRHSDTHVYESRVYAPLNMMLSADQLPAVSGIATSPSSSVELEKMNLQTSATRIPSAPTPIANSFSATLWDILSSSLKKIGSSPLN